MKGKLFISNLLKVIFTLLFIGLYLFMLKKIYNTNIWLYKSFVILMILILIIYFIYRIINKIFPKTKEIVAKIVEIKENSKGIEIIYQYLEEKYSHIVDFYEYDQNKYFKYAQDKWYTLIVTNQKIVKLLDPAMEPVIDDKILEKRYYKSLKFGLHIYMYYIYEILFLINLIIFPVIIVVTKYKINTIIFIIIELINLVLFILNSKVLKKD